MKYIFSALKKFFNFHNIAFLIIAVFFLILIFYGFPDSPSPWFDEGINLGIAKSWVEHGVFSLQTGLDEFVQERPLLITTNYPLLAFVALSFKIFGVGLWQAKIVMILFLFAFAVLFYLLTKKYYGRNCALVSLALLVTFLPFYGNGKSVLGEIPGLTYFLAALVMLDKNKNWQIFVTGLLLGLAAATKSIFLLFVISVVISEFLWAIKNKKCNFKYWILLGCGMAIPLLAWLYTLFPNIASFRYLFETISLYSNPYNTKNIILPNLLKFFTESTPVHFALLLIVFVLSKTIIKLRSFTRVESILLIFIILNFLFFLKTVGWYRYFFPAHVLLFILFPSALWKLGQRFFENNRLAVIYTVAIIFLFTAQVVNLGLNIKERFYYSPIPRQFADSVNTKIANGSSVLVVDIPEIAFLLKSDLTYQYLKNSPRSIVGRDLLKSLQFPNYIISKPWPEDFYLKDYMAISNKYALVLESSKYGLYALR